MFAFQEDHLLVDDREDLIAVLRLRFGDVPPGVIAQIYEITQADTLERLILVAANAPEWRIFAAELEAGDSSYKLLGEQFQPSIHQP